MTNDVLLDCRLILQTLPPSSRRASSIRQLAKFIESSVAFLTRHPTSLAQVLANAQLRLGSGARRPWLKSLVPGSSDELRNLTFTAPETEDAITACWMTPIHCIAGYRNGLVRVWNLLDSQLCAQWKLHEDDGPIWSLSADSTGDHLTVISIPESRQVGDDRFRFATVSISDGEALSTAELRGEIDDARMSPDGLHVALFGDEGGVILLNHSGAEVAKAVLGDKVISCEWISNEELAVTTDSSWKVFIVNPWTNEIRFQTEIEPPARSPLKEAGLNLRGISTAISHDQRWLAVGVAGGFTRVYEVETGNVTADLTPFAGDGVLELHDSVVCARCLRFSEDGRRLFEGRSRRIYAWDTANWELVGQWQSRVGLVGRFVEAENSLFAITDVRETAMRFEDTIQIAAEELPRQLPLIDSSTAFTVPGSIIGIQVSPSGRFCAVAWGPTFQFVAVRLIDLNSGASLREIARASWPVKLYEDRVMYGLGDSPPRLQVETLADGRTLADLELPGEFLDDMFVSPSGHHVICLTFESRKRPEAPPKTITVRDESTGRTCQMPDIELPPRTPFEAKHGQFDSFAYATIFDLRNHSLVWQECIGANRVRRAVLREGDEILVVEWTAGDKHWKTEHAIPSVVIAAAPGKSHPQSRFSPEPSGAFTAVRDKSSDRVIAWWPARLRTFAGSRDGYTWVGATERSSFATAFRIELTDSAIEPPEECG